MKSPSLWLSLSAAAVWIACGQTGRDWGSVKSRIRSEFPDVRQISTTELGAWLADTGREQPLLVDARTAEEYAVSHLPGAVRAESAEVVESLALPRDAPVVVYCSVGYRSSVFARQLQERGLTEVYNLEGSIFTWANEGRPLFRGEQRVEQVHPYNEDWGRLLDSAVRSKVD